MKLSTYPQPVRDAARYLGGLGLDHKYLDETGLELAEDKGVLSLYRPYFLVVGSYYGTAVSHINGGDTTRVEDDDV